MAAIAVIDLVDPRPPVSAPALDEAERRLEALGHPLPPSYRAFLERCDGGRPVRELFRFDDHAGGRDESVVQRFLGVGPIDPPAGNMLDVLGRLGDRMLPGIVPIARDPVGNFVCIDGRERPDGPVVLWDHEEEGEPPDDRNLHLVAANLEEFLGALEADTPLPAPQPGGLRRFLGGRRRP
jgi:cell wall assembly regulator SMI1